MNPDDPNSSLVADILQQYGLSYRTIGAVQSGYRNHSYRIELADGGEANLIIFKAEPGNVERINRADLVSGHLFSNRLPVRTRIDTRIVKVKSDTQTLARHAALYNYLPGDTISWDAYTKDHLKALGIAMARMHQLCAHNKQLNLAVSHETVIWEELQQLLNRIQVYFSKLDVQRALQAKLRLEVCIDYQKLLYAVQLSKDLTSQHVLHMDFVRSNILFAEQTTENAISFEKVHISGIIDFEKTTYGSPLFDLARTLAFLYVDCKYTSLLKVRKHFLYSGYVKHGGSNFKHVELLDSYVSLFLVHDFYKFLLHNPYEYLEQNEHFLRTRDILLSRNMVKYTS